MFSILATQDTLTRAIILCFTGTVRSFAAKRRATKRDRGPSLKPIYLRAGLLQLRLWNTMCLRSAACAHDQGCGGSGVRVKRVLWWYSLSCNHLPNKISKYVVRSACRKASCNADTISSGTLELRKKKKFLGARRLEYLPPSGKFFLCNHLTTSISPGVSFKKFPLNSDNILGYSAGYTYM